MQRAYSFPPNPLSRKVVVEKAFVPCIVHPPTTWILWAEVTALHNPTKVRSMNKRFNQLGKILEDVNDKIEKLWKLLSDHNERLESLVKGLRRAIENKDLDAVGIVAGQIEVIAISDVCYVTSIEILEDLRKT